MVTSEWFLQPYHVCFFLTVDKNITRTKKNPKILERTNMKLVWTNQNAIIGFYYFLFMLTKKRKRILFKTSGWFFPAKNLMDSRRAIKYEIQILFEQESCIQIKACIDKTAGNLCELSEIISKKRKWNDLYLLTYIL